jgi:glutathione gamma-glutamylcysteinyltransferase
LAVESLYRRPLPGTQVAFAAPEGRALFREALLAGTLESFFPLIEQFHTQAEPAFCGPGSLVMALNALGIDPGRMWRGPWRWFSEELLDCCTPLERVRANGVTLDELACLARCNGATAEVRRADNSGVEVLRAELMNVARSNGERVIVAAYDRAALEQTGSGHFSPLGGYHAASDMALVLDVARFKYPPHWVQLQRLHEAMRAPDAATGRARGWVLLQRSPTPASLAHFVGCKDGVGVGVQLLHLIGRTRAALERVQVPSLVAAVEAIFREAVEVDLSQAFFLRQSLTPEQEAERTRLHQALLNTQAYSHALDSRAAHAELLTIWLLSIPDEVFRGLPGGIREALREVRELELLPSALTDEIKLLRAQVSYLTEHAAEQACPGTAAACSPSK